MKKKGFKWIMGLVIVVIIVVIFSSDNEVPVEVEQQIQTEQKEAKIEKDEVQIEKKTYEVTIDARYIGNRQFKVSGITDLPNNSKIHITIYDEDYFEHDDANVDWRFENLTYVSDSTIVSNGIFSATIVASEIEAPLKSERYTVEFSFNPRSQSNSIKKIVGNNGEYLGGTFIDNSVNGLTMLETKTSVTLE